jgi:hypothetical protein
VIFRRIALFLLFLEGLPHVSASPALITTIAREERVPPKLLQTIVRLESGGHAWTLNVRGKPYVFRNRQEASAFLSQQLSRDIQNIDIGLCQINAFWHGKSFSHPSKLLDPATNLRYASRLLRRYARQEGSWMKGVVFYHSSLPVHQSVYKKKLKQILTKGRTS